MAALLVCGISTAAAQAPRFEVASVKQNKSGDNAVGGRGWRVSAGVLDWRNIPARIETIQAPLFRLVAGRTGPKMAKSTEESAGCAAMTSGHFDCEKFGATMPMLANMLETMGEFERPVVDATGLTGVYRFTLDWAPENVSDDSDRRPSLEFALRDRLGLKMEKATGPMRILVIESIERIPTGN